MPDTSFISLGNFTKPATVLLNKISDAVGGIFKPYQTIRMAKAEAEANLIEAESEIKITDLHRRAMHRFVDEEAKKQENMEAITSKALLLLNDSSAPQNVANDWITNFFDKSRIVSDLDLQQLWWKVLAGEANIPGTFSKRTVNLLADLDKCDAELFTQLCGFVWIIGDTNPVVINCLHEIYNRHHIDFASLLHLESLGLIQFKIEGYRFMKLPKVLVTNYFGKNIDLTFPANIDNSLHVGQVLFTRSGRELATVCGSTSIEGFYDFMYDQWCGKLLIPQVNKPNSEAMPLTIAP